MLKKMFLGALALGALTFISHATITQAQAGGNDCSCSEPAASVCPAGWEAIENVRVTNCCLPVEADFSSRAAFEADVKLDGWGRQNDGSYLGWYDGAWHTSPTPMNAHGGVLGERSLAAEHSFIPTKMSVMIPKVKGNFVFVTDDHGPDIKDNHVNFFGGEGNANCTALDTRATICVKKK